MASKGRGALENSGEGKTREVGPKEGKQHGEGASGGGAPTQLEAHPRVGNPYDITFDTSVSADGGGRGGVRT